MMEDDEHVKRIEDYSFGMRREKVQRGFLVLVSNLEHREKCIPRKTFEEKDGELFP